MSAVAVTAVAAALSVERQAFASGFAEATTFASFDGKDAGTYFYNNVSFKVGEKITLAPEMLNLVTYKTGGIGAADISHLYLRFTVSQKDVAKLGPWSMRMAYRYTPPTTLSAQRQGSLGTLMIRPEVSRSIGDLTVTFREALNLFVQRNGYQINVPRQTAVGNPLASSIFNATLEYSLATGLTAIADLLLIDQFVGPGPYGGSTRWNHELWQEYGLTYGGKDLAGWGLGLTVFHISEFGNQKDFRLFSRTASLNLKLNKEF